MESHRGHRASALMQGTISKRLFHKFALLCGADPGHLSKASDPMGALNISFALQVLSKAPGPLPFRSWP